MKSSQPKRTPLANDVQDLGPYAVGVVLQTGAVAILDHHAYRRLEARGQIGRMFLNRDGKCGFAYVRMKGPDNLVTVARLVVQARHDESVRYRNGNRLDLRLANLERAPRWGQQKSPQKVARDLFPHDFEAQAKWLQLQDRRRVDQFDAKSMQDVIHAACRNVRRVAPVPMEG